MAQKCDNILAGAEPVIMQTPGRLQYYRAENEPFLPDEVKWAIRMPNHIAMRELALNYEDQVQRQILAYLENNLKYDFMAGNRELNLDLTVKECEFLFAANDKVKAMAESGELQQMHERCSSLDADVSTGYIKVMDQLDRALHQITETEEEVYQSLRDKGLDRIRTHGERTFIDAITFAPADISIENLVIASGASEHASQANVLRQLVGARAYILEAKCHVQDEFLNKISPDDAAGKADLADWTAAHQALSAAYAGDSADISGDAAIFKEQVDQIRSGDMASLMDNMNHHEQAFNERAAVYEEYASPVTRAEFDNFKTDLLRHLAGQIVVKDHRKRY